MKFLKDVKEFLTNGFSIMVVPNCNKSMKQVRFNTALVFGTLAVFTVVNLFVLSSSVVNYQKADKLMKDNIELVSSLEENLASQDMLYSIIEKKDYQLKEIDTAMTNASTYFQERMEEVDVLKDQARELVMLFNEKNNTDIQTPPARSLSEQRSPLTEFSAYDADHNYILDLDEMAKQDELSQIITDEIGDFSSLLVILEEEMDFLECKPDLLPAEGRFSSPFGYRVDPVYGRRSFHKGMDIANSKNTEVVAAGAGVITYSGYNGSFGKIVIIDHGYGYKSVYAHNNKLLVEVGDRVAKGDPIAKMGSTGKSTGSHLHFEVHYKGEVINPKKVLNLDN